LHLEQKHEAFGAASSKKNFFITVYSGTYWLPYEIYKILRQAKPIN
jgi:hypothetical protein